LKAENRTLLAMEIAVTRPPYRKQCLHKMRMRVMTEATFSSRLGNTMSNKSGTIEMMSDILFLPNVTDQLHLLASGTRACPSRRSARSAVRTGVS